MPTLSYYTNVENTALVILKGKGYRYWYDEDSELYCCEKNGWDFCADNWTQLLGIVSIYEYHQPREYKEYWWKIESPELDGHEPRTKPQYKSVLDEDILQVQKLPITSLTQTHRKRAPVLKALGTNMFLQSVTDNNLLEMMSWFESEEDLKIWSGPNFRFPFDFASFKQDLKLESLKSFALVSTESNLLGFGQYYERLNKCHLGRLVVSPDHRGKGIAPRLIEKLISTGTKDLNTKLISLFVLEHNEIAMRTYERLGFSVENYPEPMPLEGCLYMVKS